MKDSSDTGILASVPDQYIALAGRSLVDPSTSLAERVSTTIDAGDAGPVRIHYQRKQVKEGKLSRWTWVPSSAEKIVEKRQRARRTNL